MKNYKMYLAELIGTALLVIFGCGVAVVTSGMPTVQYVATPLAFGLVIVAMAYSLGNISGCHVNPAVSLGMLIAKRMNLKDFGFYVLAQFIGAIIGALVVALFTGSFAALGGNAVQAPVVAAYGEGGALAVGLAAEIVLTFIFVLAVLGVTAKTDNKAVAGVVIGLSLTLVHILGMWLTGTSVNPARSFGPALLQMISGDFTAISQIWIFIVGPFLGAALAAVTYCFLAKQPKEETTPQTLDKE